MSDIAKIARFEALRSVGFGSISGTYVGLGTPIDYPGRIIKITNTTDADIFVSTDGTTDQDIVPAGGFVLYDLGGNRSNLSGSLDFHKFVRFYVREVSAAPTSGSVYLTLIYASDL